MIQQTNSEEIQQRPANTLWLRHLALILFVVATRLPLIGPFEGEPDSCRYVLGTHLWLSGDRGSLLLYANTMSPGYYWLSSSLVTLFHVSLRHYSLLLNFVSFCAALLTAPILYGLSRRITDDNIGFLSSLLFLISPAIWWNGIQAHPQSLSILFSLLSLYAFWRGLHSSAMIYWWLLSSVCIVVAMLIKIDAVLSAPALFGLLFLSRRSGRHLAHLLCGTTLLIGISLATFSLLRPLVLGVTSSVVQADTSNALFQFLYLPRGLSVLRQTLPIVMALGPAAFMFAAIGCIFFARSASHSDLYRWTALFTLWTAVGCAFWFVIGGNNPRHVGLFTLTIIWIGITGWAKSVGLRATALLMIVTAGANVLAVPPNSSTSHLMSPNVPESALLLRQREQEIRSLARDMADQEDACYVGTYTIPYFHLYVLQETSDLRPALSEIGTTTYIRSRRNLITCIEEGHGLSGALSSCTRKYSLEYLPNGGKRRYFGREVYVSPLWSKMAAAASGSL